MRVFYDFDNVSQIRRPVVTIGSYDGVHTGHREILSSIRRIAQQRDGESVVITFYPHPRQVLHTEPEVTLLNSLEEKLALLESAGVDNTVVVRFTPEFSRIGSREFVERFLVGALHIDTLMVGFNHHLGHNKDGDSQSLLALSRKFGFRLQEMPRQNIEGEKVSSTLIRGFVARGELEKAARYLGGSYFITGRLGRDNRLRIGEPSKLLPPPGKYPVTVYLPEENQGKGRTQSSQTAPEPASGCLPGVNPVSVPAAGQDGVRSFLEIGPQGSLSLSGTGLQGEIENITVKFE